MTLPTTWRRLAAAFGAVIFAALLSGCVLGSKTPLVAAEEAVEIFPAGFTFVTYDDQENGTFIQSTEQPPGGFTRIEGTSTYSDPAGEMIVAFVPRADGSHLVSVVSREGEEQQAMYGLATLRDSILELRFVFSGNPAEELAVKGLTLPDGTVDEGGTLYVPDRAAMDRMIELMADGTIATSPLIAWAGTTPAPATITKDGDWYKGS